MKPMSPQHTRRRRRSCRPRVFASHPDGASSWAWKHLSRKGCQAFYIIFWRRQDTPRLPSGLSRGSSAGPGHRGRGRQHRGRADVPGSDPSGAGASQGRGHAAHHGAGPAPSLVQDDAGNKRFPGENETPRFPFCRGAAGSRQLWVSYPWPALPGGLGRLRGHSARGSEGFVWSRRGCQAPALRWAPAGTRESWPLAARVRGADTPELGALLPNPTFPLPTLQARRNAGSEGTSEPQPPVTARGYRRNPRRDGTIHEPC